VSRKTAHGGQNIEGRPRSANGYCANYSESKLYACVPVCGFRCVVRKRETRACSSKGVAVSRADGLGRSSADDIGSRQAGDKKSAMAQKAIVAQNCYSEWHAHQRSGRQGLFIPSWDRMVAGMRDVVGQECSAEAQRSSRGRVFTSSRSHAVCGLAEMGLGGGSGSADVGARGLGRVVQDWAGQDRFEVPRQNGREQEWQNGRMAEWQSGHNSLVSP
jgi:hypothetical protein